MEEIRNACKTALRLTTNAFDDEIDNLINSAKIDLQHAGIKQEVACDDSNALTRLSIISFVKLNFGSPDEYDRLKRAYDEFKKQLGMASDYTNYEEN